MVKSGRHPHGDQRDVVFAAGAGHFIKFLALPEGDGKIRFFHHWILRVSGQKVNI
jgi:hypothetical protein